MALTVRPIELRDAKDYIAKLHRHHKAPTGHRFSLACYDGERLCGVLVAGRPVARMTNKLEVLEVTRCCTDGTYNAVSALYGAAAKAAKAMGYASIQTFTLPEEGGASMRASAFRCVGETAEGDSWASGGRGRQDHAPVSSKWKWERRFRDSASTGATP